MMTVRTAPVAQCIADDDWRIIAVDDAYTELLGRPRDEILGRSPLEFTAPVDQAINDALLRRLSRDERAFRIIKRYVRGDGALQWVSNHVSTFRDGAGPRRILATCEAQDESAAAGDVVRLRRDAVALLRTIGSAKHAFGDDLIGSPALEALLHLYLAEMEGRSLTPRCIAALIRHSEAVTLRWIKVLEQRRYAEVERAIPLDLAAPMRISGVAQRMMEDITGTLQPHRG
jgi:PAS domain S-box-containing protein